MDQNNKQQNINQANGAPANSQFTKTNPNQQQSTNTTNIRHIPIYVEGRDQPIFNKHIESDTVDSPTVNMKSAPTMNNEMPKTGSLFDRVKNFPVRINQEYELNRNPSSRGASPARPQQQQQNYFQQQQPTKVNSSSTLSSSSSEQQASDQNQQFSPATSPQQQQQQVPTVLPTETAVAPQPPPPPPQVKEDSITKIKKIQKEVLDLMSRVEHFSGIRKDREYAYLDEMLTQNLLKLDVIETDGNDNIKFARREAIKCINKCIEVLEEKAESNATTNQRCAEQKDCKYSTSTAV